MEVYYADGSGVGMILEDDHVELSGRDIRRQPRRPSVDKTPNASPLSPADMPMDRGDFAPDES